jgi:hypothetical protein
MWKRTGIHELSLTRGIILRKVPKETPKKSHVNRFYPGETKTNGKKRTVAKGCNLAPAARYPRNKICTIFGI